MLPKYALHPGYVISKNDGDEHYISAGQLARLYRLGPFEYCVWVEPNIYLRVWEDYIHLYPRYDGNYGRPDDQERGLD
jgi:hypothetical protein